MSEESSDGMIHAGSVEHFLSAAFLRRLESPLEQSTGLPNAAYTDPEFLKLENEHLRHAYEICLPHYQALRKYRLGSGGVTSR